MSYHLKLQNVDLMHARCLYQDYPPDLYDAGDEESDISLPQLLQRSPTVNLQDAKGQTVLHILIRSAQLDRGGHLCLSENVDLRQTGLKAVPSSRVCWVLL
jgi:ankyrin repeat protein